MISSAAQQRNDPCSLILILLLAVDGKNQTSPCLMFNRIESWWHWHFFHPVKLLVKFFFILTDWIWICCFVQNRSLTHCCDFIKEIFTRRYFFKIHLNCAIIWNFTYIYVYSVYIYINISHMTLTKVSWCFQFLKDNIQPRAIGSRNSELTVGEN